MLGINVPGDGSARPAELAASGARWVRCVLNDEFDITGWITELKDGHGIETLLIGDGSSYSLGTNEAAWEGRMNWFKEQYGDLVSLWQWGNEPDHD